MWDHVDPSGICLYPLNSSLNESAIFKSWYAEQSIDSSSHRLRYRHASHMSPMPDVRCYTSCMLPHEAGRYSSFDLVRTEKLRIRYLYFAVCIILCWYLQCRECTYCSKRKVVPHCPEANGPAQQYCSRAKN